MIVVSDTSPVTALLQIHRCDLLRILFKEVLIPPAVRDELWRFHAEIPDFVRVQEVRGTDEVQVLVKDLHLGEAQAIALASELRADYLMVDEKRARAIAEERGLNAIGLLGVLLLARNAGLLSSLAAVIKELEDEAGFFVSEEVKGIILKAAGEL
jgi:uncharacterized protein